MQELLGNVGNELWQKFRDNPYEKVCVVEYTIKIERIIRRPTLRNKIQPIRMDRLKLS